MLRRKLNIVLHVVKLDDGGLVVLETEAGIKRMRNLVAAAGRRAGDEGDVKKRKRLLDALDIDRATIAECERVRKASIDGGLAREMAFVLNEAVMLDYMAADRAAKSVDFESGAILRDANDHSAELIRRCAVDPKATEVESLPMRVYVALVKEFKAICEPTEADISFPGGGSGHAQASAE